ncbi:domain of Kin17 curved DNA-binding protein-domain-containing protein [Cryomyces antarcticus]
MPKAEVGSTKYLNNKLKSKGLQRLRWYCQVCERQMRDENGFKQHTMSEGHVRAMNIVGEDPRKAINEYSTQFQRGFLQLLRTSHGTKLKNLNHFYQEYIANKEHTHMNATKWPSLTEFAKHLGREGICRVEEGERGLEVAWIDNSPEALRHEEREQRLISEQVRKAELEAKSGEEMDEEARQLQRVDGEKIKLNLITKAPGTKPSTPAQSEECETSGYPVILSTASPSNNHGITLPARESPASEALPVPEVSLSFGGSSKPKNVFALKRNALSGKRNPVKEPPKKMSEAERIMKEEIERKRKRVDGGFAAAGVKRQREA